MPRTLPPRPDLAQLKVQARELQRAYNAGVRSAVQRFSAHLPQIVRRQTGQGGQPQVLLTQAQTVLAREYGFASWLLLRAHVQRVRAELQVAVTQARSTPSTSYRQRVALMAERIAQAAERRDLGALFDALRIGARDGDEARALLVEQGRFAAVVDTLLTGASHQSPRVRFFTAQAMDHWADERCANPLRTLLHDPVPRVRWAALHSLGCEACKLAPLAAGDDLTGTLIALASTDPSVKVRRVAAWELGQLCPNPQAVAALEALCLDERDPVVLRNARIGLGRLPKTTGQVGE
jgi:hypothetical protein